MDINEDNSADTTMTFASYTSADPDYYLAQNTYSSYVFSAALQTNGLRKTDYYGYIQPAAHAPAHDVFAGDHRRL